MTQGKVLGDGLKVEVSAGMASKELEFPEATTYVQDGTQLAVGTGDPNVYHNFLEGETIAVFNWDNVISVTEL